MLHCLQKKYNANILFLTEVMERDDFLVLWNAGSFDIIRRAQNSSTQRQKIEEGHNEKNTATTTTMHYFCTTKHRLSWPPHIIEKQRQEPRKLFFASLIITFSVLSFLASSSTDTPPPPPLSLLRFEIHHSLQHPLSFRKALSWNVPALCFLVFFSCRSARHTFSSSFLFSWGHEL